MKTYKHLSLEERERIFAFKQSGVTISEIGRRIKRNKGTISRELERHTKYGKEYVPRISLVTALSDPGCARSSLTRMTKNKYKLGNVSFVDGCRLSQ